ncbi:hypothetical protein [Dickeya dianthicola]|uniref:Uncharacterized protein n=1 Tax=Dickeya dianthicola TaxID=204039 RepID=A0AAX1C7M5_9GAMM|nr:hypothetical protein [Dickeya dianthicola]MCI4002822.1 hypothetical protein [Dickeya dianthicola]MCI4187963.1 hypothetical protein [Dickeya dianthicola]MCI4214761.1 hypothetical protein [Dickeya dianthicola]MCI4232030.1 hypothetical protein [Dickeya dianthicola]MZH97982.1 hypothetical protein [Dickeya dianthicola]
MKTSLKEHQSNNFELKNKEVDLINASNGNPVADVSLSHLEDWRVNNKFVTASHHGIEVICGASCETGAM